MYQTENENERQEVAHANSGNNIIFYLKLRLGRLCYVAEPAPVLIYWCKLSSSQTPRLAYTPDPLFEIGSNELAERQIFESDSVAKIMDRHFIAVSFE